MRRSYGLAGAVLVGALGLAACVPCPPPPAEDPPTTTTSWVIAEEPVVVCILEEGVDCSPPTTLHHDR